MAQTARITVTIYEKKAAGVGGADAAWDSFVVPWGTPAAKNGRTILKTTLPSLRRIPARGRVVVETQGHCLQAFEYIGVPAVRSRAPDAAVQAASLPPGPAGPAAQSGPDGVEADFPGFAALPAETWVQLNKVTDSCVVQLKLRKQPPEDHLRDLDGGDFYVYGAEVVAVQLLPEAAAAVLGRAPPMTAIEKALAV